MTRADWVTVELLAALGVLIVLTIIVTPIVRRWLVRR